MVQVLFLSSPSPLQRRPVKHWDTLSWGETTAAAVAAANELRSRVTDTLQISHSSIVPHSPTFNKCVTNVRLCHTYQRSTSTPKKIVKLCLHSSYKEPLSLHFDELFFQRFFGFSNWNSVGESESFTVIDSIYIQYYWSCRVLGLDLELWSVGFTSTISGKLLISNTYSILQPFGYVGTTWKLTRAIFTFGPWSVLLAANHI